MSNAIPAKLLTLVNYVNRMDFFCVVSWKRFGAIVLTGVFLLTKVTDVSLLTINVNPTNGKAILGNNSFTLSCTYTIGQNEQLFSIELKRKRDTESDFTTIVTYQNPSSPINLTYQDSSLESRTVATKPTENRRTATLLFNTVECDDKATYLWDAFYSDGNNQHATDTSTVSVKAVTLFSQDGRISYSPQTLIEEGDNVVFTCSGDVGNEPVGYLGWFYYLGNNTSNAINASNLAVSSVPIYQTSTCSFTRTSTLELTMTQNFNALLVRCTAQQETFSQSGEAFVQTKNIPVYYSPKITEIADMEVEEGTELLIFTCNADAYPAPTFFWFLPNGTETSGPILKLTDLQIGDHGMYTCVVYNTYKNLNHTVNETLYLLVRSESSTAKTVTHEPDIPVRNYDQYGGCGTGCIAGICVGVAVGFLIIIVACVKYHSGKERKGKVKPEAHGSNPRSNQTGSSMKIINENYNHGSWERPEPLPQVATKTATMHGRPMPPIQHAQYSKDRGFTYDDNYLPTVFVETFYKKTDVLESLNEVTGDKKQTVKKRKKKSYQKKGCEEDEIEESDSAESREDIVQEFGSHSEEIPMPPIQHAQYSKDRGLTNDDNNLPTIIVETLSKKKDVLESLNEFAGGEKQTVKKKKKKSKQKKGCEEEEIPMHLIPQAPYSKDDDSKVTYVDDYYPTAVVETRSKKNEALVSSNEGTGEEKQKVKKKRKKKKKKKFYEKKGFEEEEL